VDFLQTHLLNPGKVAGVLIAFAMSTVWSGATLAFKPEDPEVRAMVAKGVAYLGGLNEDALGASRYGATAGTLLLAAYAHYKAEQDYDAPIVKLGIKYAKQLSNAMEPGEKLTGGAKLNYEASIAILFMAEVDAEGFREDIKKIGLGLIDLQMSHGGYGYSGQAQGDISQIQYVTLAMWTLDRAGIEIPLKRVDALLSYLVRVQDPGGAWPYIATDPGTGGGLQSQAAGDLTVSTSLAGGSSALIAADIFRLWGQSNANDTGIEGFPKAIKKYEEKSLVDNRREMTKVNREGVIAATNRMDQYRFGPGATAHGGAVPVWFYYILYSLERYESFIELATGKVSTDWYDDGVRELMELQSDNGAWGEKVATLTEPSVSTAFAILFLIRSTKKAIGSVSTGSLAGGYGLPSDTTKIVVNGTQIKGEVPATAVTDLLSILENDDAASVDSASIPENLQLETDREKLRLQLSRLERVVRGSESWQARRVAARLLGTSDQLSVVPSLIYALSDNDKQTRTFAINGLQFISRRFNDFDLSSKPEAAEIRDVQKKWVAWYQKIYPNYDFIGFGF